MTDKFKCDPSDVGLTDRPRIGRMSSFLSLSIGPVLPWQEACFSLAPWLASSSVGHRCPCTQTQERATRLFSWFSREIPSRLCGLGVRPAFKHLFVQEIHSFNWEELPVSQDEAHPRAGSREGTSCAHPRVRARALQSSLLDSGQELSPTL